MIHITINQINNYFLECIEKKIPYRDTSSNIRHVVQCRGMQIITKDDRFPPGELWFIKQVKADINKLELFDNDKVKAVIKAKKKESEGTKIKYVDFSRLLKPNIKISNCFEIDIAAAYWQTAYQLGLITDKIFERAKPISWEQALEEKIITKKQYNKCLGTTPQMAYELNIIDGAIKSKVGGISKLVRLAAIGSLARKKKVTRFTGKRWVTLFERRDKLAYLWDIICWQVSQVMQEAQTACGDGFVMFWVDAMFVQNGCQDKVKEIFKKHGYGFKEYKIEKIWTTDKELFIRSKAKSKNVSVDGIDTVKNERVFQLPNYLKPAKP